MIGILMDNKKSGPPCRGPEYGAVLIVHTPYKKCNKCLVAGLLFKQETQSEVLKNGDFGKIIGVFRPAAGGVVEKRSAVTPMFATKPPVVVVLE